MKLIQVQIQIWCKIQKFNNNIQIIRFNQINLKFKRWEMKKITAKIYTGLFSPLENYIQSLTTTCWDFILLNFLSLYNCFKKPTWRLSCFKIYFEIFFLARTACCFTTILKRILFSSNLKRIQQKINSYITSWS